MLYSIKYCVQAGIGWYRLDLPSVGPRGVLDQQSAQRAARPHARQRTMEVQFGALPKATPTEYM
jgi:hypothetical protein